LVGDSVPFGKFNYKEILYNETFIEEFFNIHASTCEMVGSEMLISKGRAQNHMFIPVLL